MSVVAQGQLSGRPCELCPSLWNTTQEWKAGICTQIVKVSLSGCLPYLAVFSAVPSLLLITLQRVIRAGHTLPARPLPPYQQALQALSDTSPSQIHPHILCCACPPHPQGATAVEVVLPGPCKKITSLFLTTNNLRNYLI